MTTPPSPEVAAALERLRAIARHVADKPAAIVDAARLGIHQEDIADAVGMTTRGVQKVIQAANRAIEGTPEVVTDRDG